MKIKRILAGGTAALMALSLAACTTEEGGDANNQLEKITVCLDWTPNTNHTGLYVAQAKGYFKDAGFEVEIVQPPEGGSASMCAAGQAQFAIEAQDTMAASLALDEPLPISRGRTDPAQHLRYPLPQGRRDGHPEGHGKPYLCHMGQPH